MRRQPAVALAACGGSGSSSSQGSGPVAGGGTPTPTPSNGIQHIASGREHQLFQPDKRAIGMGHDFGFSSGLNPMVAQFAGGAAAGDIDNDGDIDVFVTRGDIGPNMLYINEGGTFREGAAAAGLAFTLGASNNGRHSAGRPSAISMAMAISTCLLGGLEGGPTKLMANDGAGNFTDVSAGFRV